MIRPIPWRLLVGGFVLGAMSFLCGRWSHMTSVIEPSPVGPLVCPSSVKRDVPEMLFSEEGELVLPSRFFPRHRDLLYRLPQDPDPRRGQIGL